MPKVPASSSNPQAPTIPPDQEVYFAMAAAQMDKEGKLYESEPSTIVDSRFPKAGEISSGSVKTAQSDRARLRYYGANESTAKP